MSADGHGHYSDVNGNSANGHRFEGMTGIETLKVTRLLPAIGGGRKDGNQQQLRSTLLPFVSPVNSPLEGTTPTSSVELDEPQTPKQSMDEQRPPSPIGPRSRKASKSLRLFKQDEKIRKEKMREDKERKPRDARNDKASREDRDRGRTAVVPKDSLVFERSVVPSIPASLSASASSSSSGCAFATLGGPLHGGEDDEISVQEPSSAFLSKNKLQSDFSPSPSRPVPATHSFNATKERRDFEEFDRREDTVLVQTPIGSRSPNLQFCRRDSIIVNADLGLLTDGGDGSDLSRTTSNASDDSGRATPSALSDTKRSEAVASPSSDRSPDDDEDEMSEKDEIKSAYYFPHETRSTSPVQSPPLTPRLTPIPSLSTTPPDRLPIANSFETDVGAIHLRQSTLFSPAETPESVEKGKHIPSSPTDDELDNDSAESFSSYTCSSATSAAEETEGEDTDVPENQQHNITPTELSTALELMKAGHSKSHSASPTKKHHHHHHHRSHAKEEQKPPMPYGAVELKPYRHQVGGHSALFRFSRRAVCKSLSNRENEFYEAVEKRHPDLLKFLPR